LGVLDAAAHEADPQLRATHVVEEYLRAIARIGHDERPVDAIVCVVPEFVYQNCRPRSRISAPTGQRLRPWERRLRARGQLGLFDDTDPRVFSYSPDFRRQLKARAMRHD